MQINITSTVIEKSIDIAKNFLGKLITPSIEETGLLLKDKVTLWRFNNQVKILEKAQRICEKHNIQLKTISLKLLCPLLEYAGLEENEILQDKWANLLSNLVDSEQNIENHVFPYLLSQISVDEFNVIETVFYKKIKDTELLNKELEIYLNEKENVRKALKEKIDFFNVSLRSEKSFSEKYWGIRNELDKTLEEERVYSHKESFLIKSISEPTYIKPDQLEPYEVSNLLRLGLIKNIPTPYAYIEQQKIENNPNSEYLYLMDVPVTIESEDDELILTDLGKIFLKACSEKNN